MSARVVVTVNGPGELMGWARPYVRALYRLDPAIETTIVFVPCPYATGREAATAQALFPRATVVTKKAYSRFLMGRAVEGMRRGDGVLQYLGGDLYHANTIAKRLGLQAMTYKFSRRHYAHTFVRFFAVDERNAAELRATGAPSERVMVAGNLVADAVLESLEMPPPAPGRGNSVCFFPGSRPPELRALLPFFLGAALQLMRERPGLRTSIAISPFSSDEEIRAALRKPEPAFGGTTGELADDGSAIAVNGSRVTVDRSDRYRALADAALVVATPGTKCIEAAVLGKPLLVILPMNKLDEIVVPGLAGYLHHIPVIGGPLKTWVARRVERRFKYVSQPNIDAGRALVPELRGVLTPADVAGSAAAMLDDPEALRSMGEELARLYAADAGAATRMAREALSVAEHARAGEPSHAAARLGS